jgi:alcohol dehydrogenase
MKSFNFRSPAVHFGLGILAQTGEIANYMGCKRAMIVTDEYLSSNGVADELISSLKANGIGCEIFKEVSPNPTQNNAVRCFELLKVSECDLVIGLGGGSPMDVAKGTALLMNNPAPLDQYVGVDNVHNNLMPMIAIPTTSGSGSETSNAAILINEETGIKAGIISARMIPATAVVDPELTLTLPPRLTAACGMDALAHAIECYTGLKATPATRMIHREAIKLIANNLRTAVGCGTNIQARYEMSLGSMYAGLGMATSGCAAVHALAYPLESEFNVSHGEANAIMLPETMRFNAIASFRCYGDIAECFGVGDGLSAREKALQAAEAVNTLCNDIGIRRLTDIGVKPEDTPGLAEKAVRIKRLIDNNPRHVAHADAVGIYQASL